MSRRKRRRRLHHDDQEMTHRPNVPAPDMSNPRQSDGVHQADKGASHTTDMLLGLQRTHGNHFVRNLVEDMQRRKTQAANPTAFQQALTPMIQRMAPTSRMDTPNATLPPESATILKEWATQYQHWFVSSVIELISEQFQTYLAENKDCAKTQAESGVSSTNAVDISQQLATSGGPDNNIFASLYLMQKGLAITPAFDPVEKWDVPDDVKAVADLFGQDVAEFVSQENSRFAEAQSVDPHAETKAISTGQDLVNLLIDNGRSWFPTVADPGSPPL